MMFQKRVALFFMVGGIFCFLHAEKGEEFVVAQPAHQKKLSHNALKEKIGSTTQSLFDSTTLFTQTVGEVEIALSQAQSLPLDTHDAFKKIVRACAECNRACGEIHKKLALIQQKCSSIGGKLLDNEKPFKHASKSMLESTLHVISTTQQRLQRSIDNLHDMLPKLTMKHDNKLQESVQQIAQELQAQERMIRGASTDFTTDECLKNT
jgi:hypothetical protein